MIEATPESRLHTGDTVVLGARREVILHAGTAIGAEVGDRDLLDFPVVAWMSC